MNSEQSPPQYQNPNLAPDSKYREAQKTIQPQREHYKGLPSDGNGDPVLPWQITEQLGPADPSEYTGIDTLAEILAERGKNGKPLSVVKFSGIPDQAHYEQVEGLSATQATKRARALGRNVANIMSSRAQEDGVDTYILEPGRFVPGADKLKRNKKSDERLKSRADIKISPRTTSHSVHVPGEPQEYQPRIVEGAGLRTRDMVSTEKQHFHEVHKAIKQQLTEDIRPDMKRISEFSLVSKALRKIKAARTKPRRKL